MTIGVKDLDKGITFYSKLLGATFHDQSILAEPYGVRCAIGWDAGIELVTPLPGRDSPVETFVEEHGEGLIGGKSSARG